MHNVLQRTKSVILENISATIILQGSDFLSPSSQNIYLREKIVLFKAFSVFLDISLDEN